MIFLYLLLTINFPLFLQITVIGVCLSHSSFRAPAFGFGHFSIVCLLSVSWIFALCFAPPAFFGFNLLFFFSLLDRPN